MCHRLAKFEHYRIIRTRWKFELFDKKASTIFDKASTPFWNMFLKLKQMFDAKVLIKRLPSFSVPKITVIRHVKPILKLQETWQTRTVLWKNARTLNMVFIGYSSPCGCSSPWLMVSHGMVYLEPKWSANICKVCWGRMELQSQGA